MMSPLSRSAHSLEDMCSSSRLSLLDNGAQDGNDDSPSAGLVSALSSWWEDVRKAHRHRRTTYQQLDWLALALPCVRWLRTYKLEYLLADACAGLSIAFMVIPQGMSYAMLAGLPTASGLYGAFMPTLAYACFGSSPHLAVGPVAITSILMGAGLQSIIPEARHIHNPNEPGPEYEAVQTDYNIAAIQVAFLASLMYCAVGICQLGFLANFLSHSVISGFTTGAAVTIGLSQLKYCLGLHVPRTESAVETAIVLSKALKHTHALEAAMCAFWLALLLSIKRVAKRGPRHAWLRPVGPIGVCLLAIAAVKVFDLEARGLVHTVRRIQSGLPKLTTFAWREPFDLPQQLQLAGVIALVDFMESISVAQTLARKNKYEIHVTQEILGMGVANFFGSMFNAYTTTGSFCRSAVLSDAGAKTLLAGAFTGLTVMLVLLCLTPFFELTPYNAMGAIVLSSVMGLFDLDHAKFLYRASPQDFLVWAAAFGGTLLLGVQSGLVIAIGLAILLVIRETAFPHVALLGRLPGTSVYRSVEQYPKALLTKHVTVVRVDAPMFFANVQWIRSKLDAYLREADAIESLRPLQYLILDMSPVSSIDATAMRALTEIVAELRGADKRLVLANPSARVKAQMQRVSLLRAIGPEWIFVSTSEAVDACASLALGYSSSSNTLPADLCLRSNSIPRDEEAAFLSFEDRSHSAPPPSWGGSSGAHTPTPGARTPTPGADVASSSIASPSRGFVRFELPELEEVRVLLSGHGGRGGAAAANWLPSS